MEKRKLDTQQERLMAMMQKLPVGVVLVDSNGQVTIMNQAAHDLLGSTEWLTAFGSPGKELVFLDLKKDPIPSQNFPLTRALEQGESIHDAEIWMQRKNGAEKLLLVDSSPTYDEHENINGAIAIIEEITERRRMEERIEAAAARSRLLASLSRAFVETGIDYPVIIQRIAHRVAEASGDACLIYLLNENATYLKLAGWHHLSPEHEQTIQAQLEQVLIPSQSSLESQVLHTLKPVMINHISSDPSLIAAFSPPLQNLMKEQQIESLIIAPMSPSGRVIGTICVLRSSHKPSFNIDDLDFFNDLSDRAAVAIENARLYAEEVQRNRELNALHDATAALLSTLDLEILLGRILDAAQRAIPAGERGLLFLVAPSTGRLEVRAMLGVNDPRIRRPGLLKDSRVERSIRQKRPLLINDTEANMNTLPTDSAEADPHSAQDSMLEQETFLMRSAIFAPLVLGDEVLGALSLSSLHPFAFNQSDLRLLVSFAATTTAAIHNAMLHAEVQKNAITDSLTGLYNRRGIEELGRHEVERNQRFNRPLSAIMIDIDHFKVVNDRYGHAAGDQVLRTTAERFKSMIRQVDIIGRYGGEEFLILLPETDLFQAVNIADRLCKAISQERFSIDQGIVSITISLGVTRSARGLTSLDALVEQADIALYQAKLKGRNRVEIS